MLERKKKEEVVAEARFAMGRAEAEGIDTELVGKDFETLTGGGQNRANVEDDGLGGTGCVLWRWSSDELSRRFCVRLGNVNELG